MICGSIIKLHPIYQETIAAIAQLKNNLHHLDGTQNFEPIDPENILKIKLMKNFTELYPSIFIKKNPIIN